jgi:hypothetical protein
MRDDDGDPFLEFLYALGRAQELRFDAARRGLQDFVETAALHVTSEEGPCRGRCRRWRVAAGGVEEQGEEWD